MLNLFDFQSEASKQISDRFWTYHQDPLTVTRTKTLPFYQILSSITGSGKTAMLAHTVETMRAQLPVAPVVLWVSKGRVVVEQTLSSLSSGKYAPLVEGYVVKPLLDCTAGEIEEGGQGLLLVATVGKFNEKSKDEGARKVFRVQLDVAEQSLWHLLKERRTHDGYRRPLVVVYDEGHNLSDQQTQLILDLDPDALIAASATTRVPGELSKLIDRLRADKGWKDADFVVQVKSNDVVEAGLVKKFIEIGGFTTPMEEAISQLLVDFRRVEASAEALGIAYRPKAIYVSKTNVVESSNRGDDEDVERPFEDRRARPIMIWRHLVEQEGIDPEDIAVYCQLDFDKRYPPPDNFHLFKGDGDYHRFTEGNYRHIIFNLSLQEGWDDPECGFAYIDKDMGSPDQVTQIVGRALRQPGACHYPDPSLNTAHFYIRTDEKGTFEDVLNDVRSKIATEAPEIELVVSRGSSKYSSRVLEQPRKERRIPKVAISSKQAQPAIMEIIKKMMDFRGNETLVRGEGSTIKVLQTVGSDDEQRSEWVDVPGGKRVTARWIFLRELGRLESRAITLCPLTDPKFDALVEYNSSAAEHLREIAEKIARAYREWSFVTVKANDNPYEVAPIQVDPATRIEYKNSIHPAYSGLNSLERDFAAEIDRTRRVWSRNPSGGGYSVPLLGNQKRFLPDFVIWLEKDIVLIDPKGAHLIKDDAARKLLNIAKDEKREGPGVYIRLITEGRWTTNFEQEPGSRGYTVWRLKDGKPSPIHCASGREAVEACLKI